MSGATNRPDWYASHARRCGIYDPVGKPYVAPKPPRPETPPPTPAHPSGKVCKSCGWPIREAITALGTNWIGGRSGNGLCSKAPNGVHWPRAQS